MNEQKDQYGRSVSYLRVSVTPRCNLKCAYCMPSGQNIYPQGDILTIREITRLIRIFSGAGVRKIRLTGGEPLIRKGIVTLVRDIKNISGIEEVTLTTNGVLLGKMAGELKRAGLDRINISLDTLKTDRMKELSGSDVLGKVLDSIEKICEEDMFPVKINVVGIKGFNDDEIHAFAEMAKRLPVEIRFIEMMPTAHNRLWSGKEKLPNRDIEKVIREKHELLPDGNHGKHNGPAKVFKLGGGAGKIGFVSPMTEKFCDGCNRLRLTAEGSLRSCLFSDSEIDLAYGLREQMEESWFLEKFSEAILCKPRGHGLETDSMTTTGKGMASIGG